MSNEEELRLECLKLAVGSCHTSSIVVKTANEFYEFLTSGMSKSTEERMTFSGEGAWADGAIKT